MSEARAERAASVEMTVVRPDKEIRELIAAGNKRFDEAVEELRKKYENVAMATLKFRWDMGKIAQQLFNEKATALHERTYGEHVLEDVAVACRESITSVWASVHLVMLYNEKDIEHFTKIGLPWRALSHLVSVRETPARNALIKKWEDGKFQNSDDLKQAIVEHNKRMRAKNKKDPEDTRQGGLGAGYVRKFNSAERSLVELTGEVMPSFLDVLKTWGKDDDVRAGAPKALEPLEKIVEIIPALETMLTEAKKCIKSGLRSKG